MTAPEDLGRLGLGRDEAVAWSALSEAGALSAPEIAARGGFGRSRAYEILRSLEERGLVEVLLGETRRYRAVPLEQHARRVLESARQVERAARLRLERADALFAEAERAGAGGLTAVRILEGRRAAHEALARLLRGAKQRATIIATGRAVLRFLDAAEGAEAYETARAHGVRTRFALTPGDDPEAAARAVEILGADAVLSSGEGSFATRAVADDARVVLVVPERDDERVYLGRDFVFEAESSALAADFRALAGRLERPPEPDAPASDGASIARLLVEAIASARREILILVGGSRGGFDPDSVETRALDSARLRGVRVGRAARGDFAGAILVVDGARIAEWYVDEAGGPGLAFVTEDPARARLLAEALEPV